MTLEMMIDSVTKNSPPCSVKDLDELSRVNEYLERARRFASPEAIQMLHTTAAQLKHMKPDLSQVECEMFAFTLHFCDNHLPT